MQGNIVLCGFMGTGKSAVGRLLAERLRYQFIDMDAAIEAETGRVISEIFATDGEAHFRALEREMTQRLARQQKLVIATGGGVVLNPDNIRDFAASGLVICLAASAEEILRRVSGSTHRPLLNQPDPARAIRELLQKRQPLYDAIPHQIDTNNKTAAAVVDEIQELTLRLYAKHEQEQS